ncbi:hypothetical protein SPI_08256 [Niveomyces insectorum RCEF 264]|uniref:Uncharacterized protein n=1 Tax=Niveomyces insectorum RCEF 264 TaxID=1081102 RepID=A0A167NHU3_9HYPO|nr:hypothetical protein SPI_08256 [Niveomyces insectorum RCEF 264]
MEEEPMEEHQLSASFHRSTSSTDIRPSPRSSSVSRPSLELLASSIQTSSSTSTLRFPTPEGSHLLAHWVTSSSTDPTDPTDTMPPPPPPPPQRAASVSDETNSLADSAYELISSTDGESQDGRGAGSIDDSLADSVDLYPRADDVHSLNGTDTPYDDDDDEESASETDEQGIHSPNNSSRTRHTPRQSRLYSNSNDAVRGDGGDGDGAPRRSSPADSIQYAEQVLDNPSTQSLSMLEYDSSSGDTSSGATPLVQSIEFSEEADVNVYLEKVSVKHTIREFTEAETVAIAANMGMAGTNPPKRLAATIRQTMSHHCLPIREPLRVMYVGSDAGYNDIMYKISSALLASTSSSAASPSSPPSLPSPSNRSARGSEQHHMTMPSIYNIMPLSSFGSTKVPEIDEIQLMGVSEYNIKVERCAKANETVYEGNAFPNDTVYSITLDSEKTYLSVFCPSGSIVTPQWSLPHVAVFYVSGNDDREAEATRNAAWEFMTRHAVPSIFISHTQAFSRSPSAGRWQNFVDQAAVHLCLESRDTERPMAPERLPIDLVSFLNIDARQMNRNLAYLTGLHDTPGATTKTRKTHNAVGRAHGDAGDIIARLASCLRLLGLGNDPRPELSRLLSETCELLKAQSWKTLVAAAISALLWSYVVFFVVSLLPALNFLSSSAAAASSPSGVRAFPPSSTPVLVVPSVSSTTGTATSAACSVPSLTPTVTISLTSTRTVEVRVPALSSSTTQAHFGGFLTDRAHQHQHYQKKDLRIVASSEIKSTGCSIQVYSNHEILVKVPSETKTMWLAKGAIDIDVWRGQDVLKSKLSTTDEGLIIEISKRDAYGVMNVSIVTTRRPKINETFAVDFGKPTGAWLLEAGASLWRDSIKAFADNGHEVAARAKNAMSTYTTSANDVSFSRPMQDVLESAFSFSAAAKAKVANRWADFLRSSSTVVGEAERAGQDAAGRLYVLVNTVQDFVHKPANKAIREAQAALHEAAQHLAPVEQIRNDVQLSVLRAQIASHLWWLRVQGKTEEHAAYEAKAAHYLQQKEEAARPQSKANSGGWKGSSYEKSKENAGGASPMTVLWWPFQH